MIELPQTGPLSLPDNRRRPRQPAAQGAQESTPQNASTRRREFFHKVKKLAEIGIGVAVISAVGHEVAVGVDGKFETEHATFVPMYELHTIGVRASDIPTDLNIMYRELMFRREDWDLDPQVILGMSIANTDNAPVFQPDVLSHLAKSHTTVMFGDVMQTDDDLAAKIRSGGVYFTGAVSATISAALAFYDRNKAIEDKKRLDEILERERREKERLTAKVTSPVLPDPLVKSEIFQTKPNGRRRLLKAILAVLGVWGLSEVAGHGALLPVMSVVDDRHNAIERIITRLVGIQEAAHPEHLAVFYRSLFMAIRLLFVAEQRYKATGIKPKIGMMIGAAHSGIEDLLVAGPEVCLAILNMFPKDIFQSTVKSVDGSVEIAASTLLFDLPENYDPNSDNVFSDTKIERTRIVDQKLLDLLNKKVQA